MLYVVVHWQTYLLTVTATQTLCARVPDLSYLTSAQRVLSTFRDHLPCQWDVHPGKVTQATPLSYEGSYGFHMT